MIKEITIREGTTDDIDLQLFSGEDPLPLTGNQDIDLIFEDANGDVKKFYTGDGKLSIVDADLGQLRLRPAANDFYFSKTPYEGYFWVHYSPTRKGAFPEDGRIIFNVSRATAVPIALGLGADAKFA